jgi:general secretion pathway protein K
LSGNIMDASSRYNLRNLATEYRNVDLDQVDEFSRLLTNLQLDPALARRIAGFVSLTVPAQAVPVDASNPNGGGNAGVAGGTNAGSNAGSTAGGNGAAGGSTSSTSSSIVASSGVVGTPMKLLQVDDLLAVPGVTPVIVERLRPFVIVLPAVTPVNINTAPAEVLAAAANVSVSYANTLIVRRKQAPWRSKANFDTDITAQQRGAAAPNATDVKSEYFLVESRIRLDRAALDAEALVYSPLNALTASGTQVKWVRQF